MSCYHPMYGAYQGLNDRGKPSYKILPGGWTGSPSAAGHPRDIPIPCGHCIGCRLDKSRQWADRMMLELDHSKTAVFCTLTYDPEHVPIGMVCDDGTCTLTLRKRDAQLFLKRLRKAFPGREIRYYLAGEYGSKTQRPHYHAIIFGLDLCDFPDLVQCGKNAFCQRYYLSERFTRIWSHGFTSLASVSWQTCAYVARYVTKKLSGPEADLYAFANIEPEFSTMSLKPGISGFFAQEHPELLGETWQYLNDSHGLKQKNKVATPAYLISKLEAINPELFADIKARKKQFSQDKLLMELQNTDLDYVCYNEIKEAELARRASRLERDKI